MSTEGSEQTMSDDRHEPSLTEMGELPVRPSREETEAARSYEAFEARAKELHPEDPTVSAVADATAAGPAEPRDADDPGRDADEAPAEGAGGMVDELRGSAFDAAKGLAGLHLTTTDVAARALGGLVERAGDASGNERVAGLARTQAGLLRSAAGRYTSLGRRLLGRG